MKKNLFLALLTFGAVFFAKAQDVVTGPTAEGSYLIEANTGFGGGNIGFGHTANTGFGLASTDGTTIWSIGAEGGYFVMDDLAVKFGLGYADMNGGTSFSYKLGGKYYIIGTVPVQVDITGASIKGIDENPLWVGIQGGYAIFLNSFVSVEPGIRYNISLNEDFTDQGVFEFRIGFALHF